MGKAELRGLTRGAPLGRALWLIVALWSLVLLMAATSADYALAGNPGPVDRAGLAELGISVAANQAGAVAVDLIVGLSFLSAGALIAWRRPRDRVALFGALTLTLLGGLNNAWPVFTIQSAFPPLAMPTRLTFVVINVASLLLFFIFPDGRFAPRWLRLPFLVWCGWMSWSVMQPAAFDALNWRPTLWFNAALIVGLGAQIYRYRRHSAPAQRQQIKWVLLGMSTVVADFSVNGVVGVLLPPEAQPARDALLIERFHENLRALTLLAVPITVAVAILRHRLWEIDLLIHRALVYGALSLLLARVYLGGVVLLQPALRALTGQTSDLATVGSTLAVAGLAHPLRAGIQGLIDRGFYRRKYDAAQVLVAFSATVRDAVDLSRLSNELLRVVDETMQPAHVSLWLRTPTEPRLGSPP